MAINLRCALSTFEPTIAAIPQIRNILRVFLCAPSHHLRQGRNRAYRKGIEFEAIPQIRKCPASIPLCIIVEFGRDVTGSIANI